MSEAYEFPKFIPDVEGRIQIEITLTPHGPGQPIKRIEEAMVARRTKYDSGFDIGLSDLGTMQYSNEKKIWQCSWLSNINHTVEIICKWRRPFSA